MRFRASSTAAMLLTSIAVAAPALAGDSVPTPTVLVASIEPQATSNGGVVTVTGVLPNKVAWSCMGTCAVWLRPVADTPAEQADAPVVAQAGVMRAAFSVRVAKAALGAAFVASVYRWTGGSSYALLASGTGMVR